MHWHTNLGMLLVEPYISSTSVIVISGEAIGQRGCVLSKGKLESNLSHGTIHRLVQHCIKVRQYHHSYLKDWLNGPF